MKIGIIGMGNMGSKYAEMIAKGEIPGMELSAITRVTQERWNPIRDFAPSGLMKFHSGEELFDAVDAGALTLDAVIIVTPHYSHEALAIKAFERGISVLCDKPAGVYSRQARNMMDAYQKAKKDNPGLLYGYVFHQRTFPIYQKIKEIIDSGEFGKIKRVSWVITDWYRPNAYYQSAAWRATWKYDGGGTLLNQCPHNLDLLTWICGVPESATGFCTEGKYHPIEVEDDAAAYLKWADGASGVFIASTGEAPGVNRLEISLDNALLVCEQDKLKIAVLDKPEIEYRNGDDLYGKPSFAWRDIKTDAPDRAYHKVLAGFAKGEMIAGGDEAIWSLYLSNAIYLSYWSHRTVRIPQPGMPDELVFEQEFERELRKKSGEI